VRSRICMSTMRGAAVMRDVWIAPNSHAATCIAE
jgi:hypothetical protein